MILETYLNWMMDKMTTTNNCKVESTRIKFDKWIIWDFRDK